LRAFATGSSEEKGDAVSESKPSSSSNKRIVCPFCKDKHELDTNMKFSKIPLSDQKKFAQDNVLYAGDVSSGAICTKSAEAERPAGPAIVDIQPHCTMSQDKPPDQENRESGLRNPICH